MAIFRTFHQGKMSAVEVTCMRSFLDHGHEVTIFTYDRDAINSQFRIADANEVVDRDRIFLYGSEPGKGSISGFSNLFRYTLLRQFGDFWIDTDVLCLSANWPEDKDFVAGWESETWIGSAVLKLPRSLAEDCIDRCQEVGDKAVWGQTGPRLVTELVLRDGLQSGVLPRDSFYPLWHQHWLDFFDEEAGAATRQACEGALAAHLWNQMLTQSGFRKELLPSAESFFGAAVRRHGTEFHFGPCSDQDYRDQVRRLRQGGQ